MTALPSLAMVHDNLLRILLRPTPPYCVSVEIMRLHTLLLVLIITPIWAKTDPAELLESLEKSFEARAAKLPEFDEKGLQAGDRLKALLDLRYLTVLESILANLNHSEEGLKKQIEIEALSSSEQKRTLEMRQDVVEYRAQSLASEKFKEPRTNPIDKLKKAYDREARKPTMDLAKALKSRDQELDRTSFNERRVDELSAQIKKHQADLVALKIAFFGDAIGKSFETPAEDYAEGPSLELLKKVITARDELLKTLRVDLQAVAQNKEEREGEVAGLHIKSTNLGVVLDNSSSMTPHLEALRKEINTNFPGSHFREIYGCALTWTAAPKALGQRDQVILSMEDLVIVKKTDALYWFSDLRDAQSATGLSRVTELLDRSGAALYVSSVDKKPSDELEPLVAKFSKFKK